MLCSEPSDPLLGPQWNSTFSALNLPGRPAPRTKYSSFSIIATGEKTEEQRKKGTGENWVSGHTSQNWRLLANFKDCWKHYQNLCTRTHALCETSLRSEETDKRMYSEEALKVDTCLSSKFALNKTCLHRTSSVIFHQPLRQVLKRGANLSI